MLYVEAKETRHQEISDYPSLSAWPLRLVCMCGHLVYVSHDRQTMSRSDSSLQRVCSAARTRQ